MLAEDRALNRIPLTAVRAFEAAARLGGFTAAAAELGLTQGAISRHVRTLEDSFGALLFVRRGRRVELTEAGAAYYLRVGEAMGLLRRAAADMFRRRGRQDSVTISLLPSLTALWLAPRLGDICEALPRVDLKIHATRALVEPGEGEADVCVRYGMGGWPGVRCSLLARETLTPVCSPQFAERHGLAGRPDRLAGLTLLGDDIVDDWSVWLLAAGLDPAAMRFGPRMDDSTGVYRAAAAGSGVALGRSLLIERELAEGRLTAPFGITAPAAYAYWLVLPGRGEPGPAARALVNWLKREMGANAAVG